MPGPEGAPQFSKLPTTPDGPKGFRRSGVATARGIQRHGEPSLASTFEGNLLEQLVQSKLPGQARDTLTALSSEPTSVKKVAAHKPETSTPLGLISVDLSKIPTDLQVHVESAPLSGPSIEAVRAQEVAEAAQLTLLGKVGKAVKDVATTTKKHGTEALLAATITFSAVACGGGGTTVNANNEIPGAVPASQPFIVTDSTTTTTKAAPPETTATVPYTESQKVWQAAGLPMDRIGEVKEAVMHEILTSPDGGEIHYWGFSPRINLDKQALQDQINFIYADVVAQSQTDGGIRSITLPGTNTVASDQEVPLKSKRRDIIVYDNTINFASAGGVYLSSTPPFPDTVDRTFAKIGIAPGEISLKDVNEGVLGEVYQTFRRYVHETGELTDPLRVLRESDTNSDVRHIVLTLLGLTSGQTEIPITSESRTGDKVTLRVPIRQANAARRAQISNAKPALALPIGVTAG